MSNINAVGLSSEDVMSTAQFFELVFNGLDGYTPINTYPGDGRFAKGAGPTVERWFKLPEQMDDMVAHRHNLRSTIGSLVAMFTGGAAPAGLAEAPAKVPVPAVPPAPPLPHAPPITATAQPGTVRSSALGARIVAGCRLIRPLVDGRVGSVHAGLRAGMNMNAVSGRSPTRTNCCGDVP